MQIRLLTAAFMVFCAGAVRAQNVEVTDVLGSLDNPTGVAIQPETGDVFVAESGAARVIRVVDGQAQPVIVEFPLDVYGTGPEYNIGPLGLAFLSKDVLVVGGGGLKDGEELLRVYKVPEKGAEPITADQMETSFKLEETEELKGEGNFYALAVTDSAIYVTLNGDDTKGWVGKAERSGTSVTSFQRQIATKEATEVDAPVGITISPEGYIVVGQMGEVNVPGDSLLTFYDASTEKMAANFKTGLHDITAVAYSAEQLYALDFAWLDASQGGLFRLVAIDDNQSECKTKKMVALDKPTAMVFDKDNALYITLFGADGEDGAKGGKLVKVTGEL